MPRKKISKSATKASKKSKLESLSQTHGKQDKYQPTTLDQVWGDTGMSKFGTMNEEDYEKKLGNMTRSDLFAHATEIGLVPVENLDNLKKRLLAEFQLHVSEYRRPLSTDDGTSQEIPDKIKKILSEGK
tara:strand:+ start:30991 stop:31377 length:387 start_codon:yes stop_codon:yes gene_type:complete